MAPEITPDSIRDARFRTVIRGSDTNEVAQFLESVAAQVEELIETRDRLTARLGDFADRDLKSEFENVGREVASVLESAREAADSMRERATLDATRWRSEATAEAESERKSARSDAEALRRDAWTAGTELLNQAVAEADRMQKLAERESITITGEAEREAHRLVSTARREAEDLVRAATMNAEKLTVDATKAHDEMIEQARRQAEASQERTRALEQRREELMEELEGVRSTLSQLEGTLEAKREDLNLSRSHDSSVRIVPASSPAVNPLVEDPVNWEPGETVRVVRETPPSDSMPRDPRAKPVEPPAPPAVEEEKVEKVEAEARTEPEPKATEPVESPIDTRAETPPPQRAEPTQPGVDESSDDVGALFASLREPADQPQAQVRESADKPEVSTEPVLANVATSETGQSDDGLIEERDALLLSITNRALRGIKKAITEAQNVALDGLRTDSDWTPDPKELAESLRADLIGLWSESFSAGHDRAEVITGSKLKRPATPSSKIADSFGSAITEALETELSASGTGQRERQAAASKVFRAWRTDEAERRVREVALLGFHKGLVGSAGDRSLLWIAAGTPCSACKEASANPGATLPPVHPGCECTATIVQDT